MSEDIATGSQVEEEIMNAYRKNALSVVFFRIYYTKDDFEEKKCLHFQPDMAHQIFGENESIFGYRSLSITLNYHHNSSRCYVDITSSGAIQSDLYRPDNITDSLNSWLPENFTTDSIEFSELLKSEKHNTIFGTVLNEFQDSQECTLFPNQKVFSKYKITLCDISDEDFKEFHSRFETFIVWFIDGANFIDLDDTRWLIFYVYEELQHPETKETFITPVGFCTVYKFFAYPSNVRARISQFFVLPSHQSRGVGTRLYKEVVTKIREMPEVIDITVEEPTSKFKRIRDLDDALIIHKQLENLNVNFKTCSQEKMFKLIKEHKICKRQCQRLYDILGCVYCGQSSPLEYRRYLEKIKRRIAFEVERESKGSKRICNASGEGVNVEPAVIQASIDTECKKYIDDIEPSIERLKKKVYN